MQHIAPLFPTEFPRVLVPVDCTPEAKRQVALAAGFAYPMAGVRMTLMTNVPSTPEMPDADKVRASRVRHADDALKQAADLMASIGTYCVRSARAGDSLPEAVLNEVAAGKYNVVVLSSSYALRPMNEEDPCGPTWSSWLTARLRIPLVIAPDLA